MSLNHWSSYWASGSLTSLPQDFAQNYDGEIKQFWASCFSNLSDGDAVLDLCTGNGAVALLCAQYALQHKLNISIIAVDGAVINVDQIKARYPDASDALGLINFVSETLIEKMQLEQDRFNLITSQYGIEYCDWSQVATKVDDYLAPGGHLAFIAHAPHTEITQYMTQEQSQYQWLEALGVFDGMKQFLRKQLDLKQLKKQLKKQRIKLNKRFQQQQDPLLKGFVDYANYMTSPQSDNTIKTKEAVLGFYRSHHEAFMRLNDILGVTNRIAENPKWYQAFESDTVQLMKSVDIHYRGRHLAGTAYDFIKKGL